MSCHKCEQREKQVEQFSDMGLLAAQVAEMAGMIEDDEAIQGGNTHAPLLAGVIREKALKLLSLLENESTRLKEGRGE